MRKRSAAYEPALPGLVGSPHMPRGGRLGGGGQGRRATMGDGNLVAEQAEHELRRSTESSDGGGERRDRLLGQVLGEHGELVGAIGGVGESGPVGALSISRWNASCSSASSSAATTSSKT